MLNGPLSHVDPSGFTEGPADYTLPNLTVDAAGSASARRASWIAVYPVASPEPAIEADSRTLVEAADEPSEAPDSVAPALSAPS